MALLARAWGPRCKASWACRVLPTCCATAALLGSGAQFCRSDERGGRRAGISKLPEEVAAGMICNSGDSLAEKQPADGKLLWYFRHGQSTGNAAKLLAMQADQAAGGGTKHLDAYTTSFEYIDTPLSEAGKLQALRAQEVVSSWKVKPVLVVCSPLTRAIQTAAIIFERELIEGSARLVIRPELREFFPDNNENQGRPVAQLLACPQLQALTSWPRVEEALCEDATLEWRQQWDSCWAQGSGGEWQKHCGSLSRLLDFRAWLSRSRETTVAVVAHFGSINNLLNLEPWADGRERELPWRGVIPAAAGGLAKRFALENCSWVAFLHVPQCDSLAQ
eukprot:TRINITY_DN114419_c0_g1_i1.p1 TRINITY_DN114419_c0_g1~~TRINITY_DN114419_c0_g1_i1.p1  ORF type:complete len:342 (-),score=67.87 TRINITY_DN114419_c0_g1_i1:4-1005(-)